MGDDDVSFKTLNSISNQLFRNFEVIVVGEIKKEKFDLLAKTFITINPNAAVYTEKDLQSGIKRAAGEYMAFCQNGDIWTTDYLEKKTKLAEMYKRPLVIVNDIRFGGIKDIAGI